MAHTPVKSANVTATGSVYGARTRVKSLWYVCGATAGTIVLKDGGSDGSVQLTINVPALSAQSVIIPEDGILFDTDVHATLTNVTSLTVFYG